jgi:PEP-CTERM motif
MRNLRFNLATISVALCLLFAAAGPASATTTTFTLDSNPVVAFSFVSIPVSGGGTGTAPLGGFIVTLPPSTFEQTLTVGAQFNNMILDAFADINNTPTLVETITFGDDFVASNTLRSSSSGSQPLADVTIDFQTEAIDFVNPNGGPIGGGTSTPEPSTLLLFGSGFGALIARRGWRKKKRSLELR